MVLREREYIKQYAAKVRSKKLPDHSYVRPSHCGACRREYNRDKMREYRQAKRAEI